MLPSELDDSFLLAGMGTHELFVQAGFQPADQIAGIMLPHLAKRLPCV
jgi:hypothetical protein